MQTRVKICGNTQLEDARLAAELGADYLGFIFYDKSPRSISLPDAAAIASTLKVSFPAVQLVGVFVSAPVEQVVRFHADAHLDLVQLHGSESPAYCRSLEERGIRTIKALRIGAGASIGDFPVDASSYLLCDTFDPQLAGGTGRRFDPACLPAGLPLERTFIAGGLTPENVAEVVRQLRPFAVDVASGVEESPGCKSAERVRLFMRNIRGVLTNT